MLTAAFARAGIFKEDTEFDVAIARYLANGGTIERAHDRIDRAAQRMRSGGHNASAQQRQSCAAPASQPYRNGTGQAERATGQTMFARPVAKEPSASRRAAMGSSRNLLALTVLDTRKTHDGRAWGDVGVHELDSMDRDGAIARAIRNKLGALSNAQRFMNVRDLVKPQEFERILQQAKE